MEVVKKKKSCSVWTGADNSIALLFNYCTAYRHQTAEGRETLLPFLPPINDFRLQICLLALKRKSSRDDVINPLRAVRLCSSGASGGILASGNDAAKKFWRRKMFLH